MPMVMENLTIAQHWNTLHCATICGGGYWLQIHKFKLRDYVYLQQIMLTILDDYMTCFFCVQKVLPFRMLLLEGQDGQTWKDHVGNCTCHFPHMAGPIDPSLIMILVDLQCMLCGQYSRTITMLMCD
jgi:hypothetical protein